MGFVKEKYTREYFLGGIDDATGETYGAAGYEAFRDGDVARRHRRHVEIARAALGGLEGKAILDIGCGRGDIEKLVLEYDPARVVAIDFSPVALDIASGAVQHPSLEFHEMEATDIPWREAFDLIFMLDVLEHIPTWEADKVMERVAGALRPGGVLVIKTPMFDTPGDDDAADLLPSTVGMHCNKQTVATLRRLLRRHRLSPLDIVRRRWIVKRTEDVGALEWTAGALRIERRNFERLLRLSRRRVTSGLRRLRHPSSSDA